MDSDEDEVFFGPITEKEERIASKYRNRRTLVLPYNGPLVRRRSTSTIPACNSEDKEYQQLLASESMHVSFASSGCENYSLEVTDYDSYGSRNRAMVFSNLTDSKASSTDCHAPSSDSSLNIQQDSHSEPQPEIIMAEVHEEITLERADPNYNLELQSGDKADIHEESSRVETDHYYDPKSKETLRVIHDELHRTEPDEYSELQPDDILAGIQDESKILPRSDLDDHKDLQSDDSLAEDHNESHRHETDYQSETQEQDILEEDCDESNKTDPDYHSDNHEEITLERADPKYNLELQSGDKADIHEESSRVETDHYYDPKSKDTLRVIHDELHRTEPDEYSELQPDDILAGIQDESKILPRSDLDDHKDLQSDDSLAEDHNESHRHETDYQSETQEQDILEEDCDESNKTDPDYHSKLHTDNILKEICYDNKRNEPDYHSKPQSEDMLEGLQNNTHTLHTDEEDDQGVYEHTKSPSKDFLAAVHESDSSHEYSHSLRDDFNDSCDDSHSTHNESTEQSSPRFNDTLEEIELLLKYGVNYGEQHQPKPNLPDNTNIKNTDVRDLGIKPEIDIVITSYEDKRESNSPSSPEDLGMHRSCLQDFESKDDVSKDITSHDESLEEIKSFHNLPGGMFTEKSGQADDPIVSPRKSSVASTVSNFQPAFESTRASTYGAKHIDIKQSPSSSPAVSENEGKREPPPKPPRNIHGTSSVEKKTDNIKKPSLGLLKNASCEKPKLHLKNNQSSSVKTLHLLSNPGSSKRGATLLTPKQIPTTSANMGASGSRLVQGGSGPGRLGLTPRIRPAPSPTSTPTSSRVVTKSQTPGTRHYSLKKNVKSDLPPHPVTINKQMRTIAPKLASSQASANKYLKPVFHKIQRQPFKPGMTNIVSPIARYLKDNPPPPLIHTIKPRHPISPRKQQGESLPVKLVQNSYEKTPEVTRGARREMAFNSIQQSQDDTSSKRKDVQAPEKKGTTPRCKALPYVVSSSAMPVVLGEDKENKMLRHRGKFLVEREPVSVLKHTGRLKVPKGAVIKTPAKSPNKAADFKSPMKPDLRSPTKNILKPNFSVSSLPRSLERESLVEVSICEPC
ncbi:hypothetical protein Pcinc_015015 [Petrolisthes cinctipes]|uniref:Uncharacterized protein n=1 Tax=Petrolisthes cinctipes TaxID=88211 RepID=A0AAE1KSN0_PETCI|nr:hypothetical protein Pcinc_015015 [Petrolisthes cinctipes]